MTKKKRRNKIAKALKLALGLDFIVAQCAARAIVRHTYPSCIVRELHDAASVHAHIAGAALAPFVVLHEDDGDMVSNWAAPVRACII